jgi:hypothetical protein
MDVVRQQVTADELLLMPDDGFRYELVKGELRRMTGRKRAWACDDERRDLTGRIRQGS